MAAQVEDGASAEVAPAHAGALEAELDQPLGLTSSGHRMRVDGDSETVAVRWLR